MKRLPFKHSALGSVGIELEYQLISPQSMGLVSRAKDLIRHIKQSPFQSCIKPEITQSMIEINSSIHTSPQELLLELEDIQAFLLEKAAEINILICGGGTHPFQKWALQKIFPTMRYKKMASKYRYLSKRGTVFGQHIHVGCPSPEDALYLTHAMTRYVPQIIAICASSPFYQGIDTGYFSARSNIFNSFPLHGVMPWLLNWEEFSKYYYQMREWDIIHSMKDVYWDIRPKPEFGTVEIRVADTPLTIQKAVMIAAYVQALSLYLLTEKPVAVTHNLYYLYETNRFQACRYGFEGDFINPENSQHSLIADDIMDTAKKVEKYANRLQTMGFISQLIENVMHRRNDAALLRNVLKQTDSFAKVVAEQCKLWASRD